MRRVKSSKRISKDQKKNYNKKFILCLLSSFLFLTSGSFVAKKVYDEYEKKRVKHENNIGYYDVMPYDYFKVKSDNFVLLNIGDYNNIGTLLFDKKIDTCIQNDISVGIVIEANVATEEKIYNDVELTKGILQKYDIDLPVFFKIDNIMENESLNVETKTRLIKDFLDKCQSNGMYISVYGKDDNLCKMKEYCKITDYDSLVIGDKENIKYDGNYTMVMDNDGKIYSNENLSKVIKENNLNNSENFLSDGSYKVGKDETIMDVSFKFGISVNELLSFNDLKKEDINEGVILRIPSIINTNTYIEKSNPINLEEPKMGVDISVHQGKNIDWDKLKSNVNYAILRVSYGTSEDALFESNVVNCNRNNIPVGIYCYNTIKRDGCDDLTFYENIKKEATFVVNKLKNKKIDYPVFIDLEENEKGTFRKVYSLDDINIILSAWNEVISDAGYIPGVYCNRDVYQYIYSSYQNIDNDFCTWIAGGEQYDCVVTPDTVNIIDKNYKYHSNDYTGDILQVSQYGRDFGAGNIDVDLSYVDFANKDKELTDDPLFDIKEFDQYEGIKKIGLISGSSIVLASGLLLFNKKKRVKK